MEKPALHDNRNYEDHLGAKVESHNEDGKWEGQELGVTSDPLIDAGTGKFVLIRKFDYALKPGLKKKEQPKNKQEIFNAHTRQIREFIWKDGMTIREDVPPRVILGKKGYMIFVTCEAKSGVMWNDKAQTLQEINKK
jgi:hypothetical protein